MGNFFGRKASKISGSSVSDMFPRTRSDPHWPRFPSDESKINSVSNEDEAKTDASIDQEKPEVEKSNEKGNSESNGKGNSEVNILLSNIEVHRLLNTMSKSVHKTIFSSQVCKKYDYVMYSTDCKDNKGNKSKSCKTEQASGSDYEGSGSDDEEKKESVCKKSKSKRDKDTGVSSSTKPLSAKYPALGPSSTTPCPQSTRPPVEASKKPDSVKEDKKKQAPKKGLKLPIGFGFGKDTGRMVGDYPAEYNAKVHGPYDPARYYGKPDTPFGQVKLSELGSWFGRRNLLPQAGVAMISRAYWRWQHKYMLPQKTTLAPVLQVIAGLMLFSYSMNRFKIRNHKYYKYH